MSENIIIDIYKKYYKFLESDVLMNYIDCNLGEKYIKFSTYPRIVQYVDFHKFSTTLHITVGYFGETRVLEIHNDTFNELLKEYLAKYKDIRVEVYAKIE